MGLATRSQGVTVFVQGANILVDRSGEAKLADFGASRNLGKLGQEAQSLRGTPAFMVRN